jgi:TRAP-type uncharacterized transport system fused permease subunit
MIALSAGIEGFFLKRIAWVQRVLLLASGILIFVPSWWPRLLGGLALVVILVWLRVSRRKEVPATALNATE